MWRRLVATLLTVLAVVGMARTVELFIDGAWVDVAVGNYVLADDTITITRGGDAQSAQASPSSTNLTLYDPDRNGRWSNRVPTSPYFRKLGRNLPIRVSVDGDVRWVGEIPKWEPRWEPGDKKVRTPIQAAGILRRLTQGARSLDSALYRAILDSDPYAYWPLELDSGNGFVEDVAVKSPVQGIAPMTVAGTLALGSGRAPGGSRPVLDLAGGGRLTGVVPSGGFTDYWEVEWVATFPKGQQHDIFSADMLEIRTEGTIQFWDATADSSSTGVIYGAPFGPNSIGQGSTVAVGSQDLPYADGLSRHYKLTAEQVGAQIEVKLYIDGVLYANGDDFAGAPDPGVTGTLGRITSIELNSTVSEDAANAIDATYQPSVGHIAVRYSPSAVDTASAAFGYPGETAGRRIERLCDENGVAFTALGDLDDTASMGPQQVTTLVANLQACAVADRGALYETRTELGLSYRTRVSLYNQFGPLLNYPAGVIAPPLRPSEDDRFIHNDVTVQRPGGSWARSVLEEAADLYHTLSTQDPPNGVGTYDRGPVDAIVETDDQLQETADWIRHVGTWDGPRYPDLSVEFAAPDLAADASLSAALGALEFGDQLRLDGLPAWLPPDQDALLVQGSVESIGTHTRRLTWSLVPGWPWEVWQLETGGSTLVAGVSSSATSLKLATSTGPPWSTTAEPYHIQIDGEAMTVTAMTTDTPAFIAAGSVSTANNASVTPTLPAGMTADAGQLMVMQAAIRGTSANPNTPTGWTLLANHGNVRIYGRYYVTGDSAPTVTFTGGAAGDDTAAKIMAFSGLSIHLDDGRYAATNPSPQTGTNSSAQDIAYPSLSVRRDNCVVFYFGQKADDWTSVATIAGAVEDWENAMTAGNDQGIVADHVIQTSATDIAAGSFVVTGGAAAVSKAITLALRPLQSATVTRSVNGVSKSLAAGSAANGWRLGVLAL